mmetsp:Transcript_4374/g.17559  ORF Transcript_4374/g.17559 Transcript_4374/m.17559 type:complete len:258 (+) Transcript_4374:1974-2747(+)
MGTRAAGTAHWRVPARATTSHGGSSSTSSLTPKRARSRHPTTPSSRLPPRERRWQRVPRRRHRPRHVSHPSQCWTTRHLGGQDRRTSLPPWHPPSRLLRASRCSRTWRIRSTCRYRRCCVRCAERHCCARRSSCTGAWATTCPRSASWPSPCAMLKPPRGTASRLAAIRPTSCCSACISTLHPPRFLARRTCSRTMTRRRTFLQAAAPRWTRAMSWARCRRRCRSRRPWPHCSACWRTAGGAGGRRRSLARLRALTT